MGVDPVFKQPLDQIDFLRLTGIRHFVLHGPGDRGHNFRDIVRRRADHVSLGQRERLKISRLNHGSGVSLIVERTFDGRTEWLMFDKSLLFHLGQERRVRPLIGRFPHLCEDQRITHRQELRDSR